MSTRRLATIVVAAVAVLLAVAFPAEGYVGKLGGRTEIKDVKANEEVQRLGRFCVEEYNRKSRRSGWSNGGGEVKFAEVVEAERQVVSGMKYYLKISATVEGESKLFDSVVVVKPWLRSKQLLHFSPSRILLVNEL